MTALTHLPSIANARLPAVYEQARAQLAECARIDECKDWADKAAALASYAKQADDKSLETLAMRIRARAIKRCGELLKRIKASKGGRPSKTRGSTPPSSRAQAARDADLTRDQKRTALRVAAVPDDEFEALVESDDPPTVIELAERGKKSKPLADIGDRDPEDYRLATNAMGRIRDLAMIAKSASPAAVVRGVAAHERKALLDNARLTIKWLRTLTRQLGEKDG